MMNRRPHAIDPGLATATHLVGEPGYPGIGRSRLEFRNNVAYLPLLPLVTGEPGFSQASS